MIEFDKEAMPQKTNLDALRETNAEEIGEVVEKVMRNSGQDGPDYLLCEDICPAKEYCLKDYINRQKEQELDEYDDPGPTDCKRVFTNWLNSPVEVKEDA